MSQVTQSKNAVKVFRDEIERLAMKHNIHYLLEPSTEDSEYAYFRYIEDGYTPPEALKHIYENSGLADDLDFS